MTISRKQEQERIELGERTRDHYGVLTKQLLECQRDMQPHLNQVSRLECKTRISRLYHNG